jgi:hypothetical protein
MNAAAELFGAFLSPQDDAVAGLKSGYLQRVGSVVRWASGTGKGGQIHSYLQETGLYEQLASTSLKLGEISKGLQVMQAFQVANLALEAVNIGVSVAGFALMNAKLNAVQGAIQNLSLGISLVSGQLDQIRQERIDEDFLALRSLARRLDEAWHLGSDSDATHQWLSIQAEARRYQDLFEHRARLLLTGAAPEFALADRMIDALALTGSLRTSAAMAANQGPLAKQISDENAQQIEALTGSIGLIDLVRTKMPAGIDPGSQEWELALAEASNNAGPQVTKMREREASAMTRSAPLPLLERRKITPNAWLRAAREETNEPLLLLSA